MITRGPPAEHGTSWNIGHKAVIARAPTERVISATEARQEADDRMTGRLWKAMEAVR